jgi:hypothetical protein
VNVAELSISESREIAIELKTVIVLPSIISTETVRVGIEQGANDGQVGLLTEILTARDIGLICSR